MSDKFVANNTFLDLLATASAHVVGECVLVAFTKQDAAQSIANYIAGYVKRVIPQVQVKASAKWSEKRKGFVPQLTCVFPNWGTEEGLVLLDKNNNFIGIGVVEPTKWTLVPIKAISYFIRTESGTLYIHYQDGTAFCRSKSDGAISPAKRIFYADYKSSREVYQNGGALRVNKVPSVGLVPVYVGDKYDVISNVLILAKGSFRIGTDIKTIIAA